MYKVITFILITFSSVLSISYAQEDDFSPIPINTTSSMLPKRSATPSPQGFANSTQKAYQSQRAQVSAIVEKQQIKAMQNKAAAGMVPNPKQVPVEKPPTPINPMTEPPQTINQSNPKPFTPPVASPQEQQPTQPYTGFQTRPSSPSGDSSSPSPNQNNNQNTGGWGSSIKY